MSNSNTTNTNPNTTYSNYGMDFTEDNFNASLKLIVEAVQDERNHRTWFENIYKHYLSNTYR